MNHTQRRAHARTHITTPVQLFIITSINFYFECFACLFHFRSRSFRLRPKTFQCVKMKAIFIVHRERARARDMLIPSRMLVNYNCNECTLLNLYLWIWLCRAHSHLTSNCWAHKLVCVEYTNGILYHACENALIFSCVVLNCGLHFPWKKIKNSSICL